MQNAQRTPLYNAWVNMRQRCLNPRVRNWCDYGGRGITICVRWNSYASFQEDMGPTWEPGLTLDRRDNEGNYEPGNCRWVNKIVQNRNTRTAKITAAQAEEIRKLRKEGVRPGELARRFKVSPSIISNVLHSWSHVAKEYDASQQA